MLKLFNAGIQGRLWKWIRAFLQSREFFIVHSNCESGRYRINAGVPQGCVLSPFLFLVYINDLPVEEDATSSQTISLLFADDICMLPALHLLQSPLPYLISAVQRTLDAFTRWSIKWKMKFNLKKSNIVLFSRANTQPAFSPLYLDHQQLASSTTYKYLGLLLDRKLRFEAHAAKVLSTLQQQSYLITRTIFPTRNPSPSTIRSLVIGKLYSYLSYSLPFWQPTVKQYCKINSILAAPLRVSLGLPCCAARLPLFLEFRCLPAILLRNSLLFRFFRKLAFSPPSSPFRTMFYHYFALLKPPPMVSALMLFEGSMPFRHHEISNLDLKLAFLQLHHSQCIRKKKGKYILQFLSKLSLRTPPYLRFDPKPLVLVRARLRFNLSMLNSSAFTRGQAPSAICPHCPDINETRDHVLLDCPAFARIRSSLSTILDQPLTLEIILDPAKSQLRPTGEFLLNINRLRPM
jgi:hypothetical protein